MSKMNPLDHPICFTIPMRVTPFSAWIEHIPFAMFLVDILKPEIIVELGTHNGDSYCAFCQAVKELKLETRCYAIDTWQGDPQAGFYGPEVLTDLRNHHDLLYGSFSNLIQCTFDEALPHFENGTIDILHIDGYHTYEAVKHDFESWLPKVKSSGIVLLHDINVRERDFGARKFWDEIKLEYSHFEFLHCHGLGVLVVGKIHSRELQSLFDATAEETEKIRNLFFRLGRELTTKIAIENKEQELQDYQKDLMAKSFQITKLSNTLQAKDNHINYLEASLEEKSNQIIELDSALQAKDNHINNLEASLEEKSNQIIEFDSALQTRGTHITTLASDLEGKNKEIIELNNNIQATEIQINQIRNLISQSIVMKLQSKYQKIVEKLLRLGTKRRSGYELILRGIRVVLNEGWRSFFRKTRIFLKNKILNRNGLKISSNANIGYCITFFNQKSKIYLNKLVKLNPSDARGISKFIKKDSSDPVYRFALLILNAHQAGKNHTTLIIDHSIGGGGNIYSKRIIGERLAKYELILQLTYDVAARLMKINAMYKEYKANFSLRSLDDLLSLMEWIPCGEIFYNNLVSFPKPLEVMRTVCRIKQDLDCYLTVAMHDYFPVCPTINLLNNAGQFCGLADLETCRKCLSRNPLVFVSEGDRNIDEWRNVWGRTLMLANTILCFSESSWNLLKKVYSLRPEQTNIRPHELPEVFTRKPKFDINGPLNIGVVGSIFYHKGSEVVVEAAKILAMKVPDATITVIGTLEGDPGLKNLKVTGPYQPCDLPSLIEKHRVNICLFPSIWPETFSFVCSELMELGMPLCCFGLGAQGERVAEYKLGNVINEINPRAAVEGVIQLFERLKVESNDLYIHKRSG